MIRRLRRWHLLIWVVFGPLAIIGLVIALSARQEPVVGAGNVLSDVSGNSEAAGMP